MDVKAIIQKRGLRAGDMTVRAQAVAERNPDDLRWDIFFNRTSASTMRLLEMTNADFRFVAERRPYDTSGIEMPEKFGELADMLFLPIQNKKTIGEEELQMLGQGTDNEELMAELLRTDIPGRVDNLTLADLRRLEVDCFQAWATGMAQAKNYRTKEVALVSYGFDAERHQTAATAWNDGTINALNELIAWLRDAKALVGTVQGAYLDGTTLQAIMDDAGTDDAGLPYGQGEVEQIVASKAGINGFSFVVDDREYDTDLAGGKQRVWPEGRVAAIPNGFTVGRAPHAPVTRASNVIDELEGSQEVSERDVVIVYVPNNDGTSVQIQAQLNAYPAPNGQRVAVIDSGVRSA